MVELFLELATNLFHKNYCILRLIIASLSVQNDSDII